MAKKNNRYTIAGMIVDEKTKKSMPSLRVEAWDKDLIINDFVGSAVTDDQGAFRIEFTQSHFRELFLDREPDLYFKVYDGDKLIKCTEDSALWNVKAGKTTIVIEVDVPPSGTPSQPRPVPTIEQPARARLINRDTGAPLSGTQIHFLETRDGLPPCEIGSAASDAKGTFQLPDLGGRRVRLHLRIVGEAGVEIHRAEARTPFDKNNLLEVRVPIPAGPCPPAASLPAVLDKLNAKAPQALRTQLAEWGIRTLTDIRFAGGLGRLEGLAVAADHPAVRELEAHANLDVVQPDFDLNASLIGKGFSSISAVAGTSRELFVKTLSDSIGELKANELHVKALVLTKYFDNALAGYAANQANGVSYEAYTKDEQLLEPKCACDDCEAAISPVAYLAVLLDHAGTLKELTEKYHQPFGDLPTSCEQVEKLVRQVRCCIEVLRSYIRTLDLKELQRRELENGEKQYVLAAYLSFLNQIGTSFEELRLARTLNADAQKLEALASRLGIVKDGISSLLLDPDAVAGSTTLDEFHLEQLFGLRDTRLHPLSQGVTAGDPGGHIARWQLRGVEWLRNTDSNGLIFATLKATPPSTYRVQVFADTARTKLTGSGELTFQLEDGEEATVHSVPIPIQEEESSGLSGLVHVNYKVASDAAGNRVAELAPDNASIEFAAVSKLLSMKHARLRAAWEEEDRPTDAYSLGLLPVIDPDVIGPDDFRRPVRKASSEHIDQAFDLWLERRQVIRSLVAVTRNRRETEGLESPIKRALGRSFSELNVLNEKLYSGVDKEATATEIQAFHISLEAFTRLMTIWNKDEQARRDRRNPTVTEDEWREAESILAGVEKRKRFEEWIEEERARFIFTWGQVPGPESERLRRFLIHEVGIPKEETETITKSDNGGSISLSSFGGPPVIVITLPKDDEDPVAPIVVKQTTVYECAIDGKGANTRVYARGIEFGPKEFWISLTEPQEGYWPPLRDIERPVIDPERMDFGELPRDTKGQAARVIWEGRRSRLDLLAKELNAKRPGGFDAVLEWALGNPNPGDALSGNHVALLVELDSGDTTRMAAALGNLRSNFYMGEAEFRGIMAVRAKDIQPDPNLKPTPAEWAETTAILVTGSKLKRFDSAWSIEERDLPFIDPDVLILRDLPDEIAGERTIGFWKERRKRVDDIREELRAKRESEGFDAMLRSALGQPGAADPLPVDIAAVEDALRTDVDVENAKIKIAAQLHMTVADFVRMMTLKAIDALNDPLKAPTAAEWNEVYGILASAQKIKREFPAWGIQERAANTGVSYWTALKSRLPLWRATAEDRQQWQAALRSCSADVLVDPDLLDQEDIRQSVLPSPARALWEDRRDWVRMRTNLFKVAPHTLSTLDASIRQVLGTTAANLAALESERAEGKDISRRLDQLGITSGAFSRLFRLRQLVANGSSLLQSEWDEVYSILIQTLKRRRMAIWRAEEAQGRVVLGPDLFTIPPRSFAFPPRQPRTFDPWRATWSARRQWQDKLQSRIDQQASIVRALEQAIGATEEAVLPSLRDSLVMATDAPGNGFSEKAGWLSDLLLIETQNSGRQTTTRIAQAIHTIQSLLWGGENDVSNWKGSYAIWRAAALVMLYPENILLPILRMPEDQTPAFRQLVRDLQEHRQLTPQYARDKAAEYSDYFRDVCMLEVEGSCRTWTSIRDWSPDYAGDEAEFGMQYRLWLFARSKVSNKVYWCLGGQQQTFWVPLKELDSVLKILGVIPYQTAGDQWLIYLYAQTQSAAGEQTVVAIYDSTTGRWQAPVILESEVPVLINTWIRKETIPATNHDEGMAWKLEPGNRFVAGHFTSKVAEDIVVVGANRIGILSQQNGGLVARYTSQSIGDGWPLGGGTQFVAADVDGDGKDEIVSFRADGYVNVLRWEGQQFTSAWSGMLSGGWSDLLPVDFNGDGGKSLIAIHGDGLGVSILDWHKSQAGILSPPGTDPDRLLEFSIRERTADGRWVFGSGHRYIVITVDQNQQRIAVAHSGSLGLLRREGNGLVAEVAWSIPAGRRWGVSMVSADVDGDGRSEFLAINTDTTTNTVDLWIVRFANGTFDLVRQGPNINEIDGPIEGGWRLDERDHFIAADLDGDGQDEILVTSFDGKTLGIMRGRTADPDPASRKAMTTVYITENSVMPPGGNSDEGWKLAYNDRFIPADIDGNGSKEILVLKNSGSTAGVLHALSTKFVPPGFGARLFPLVAGPFSITDSENEGSREAIQRAFENNAPQVPRSNLVYVWEAYYFVPVHIALQLQAAGQYTAALAWFRTVYGYRLPEDQRKICYGLVQEGAQDQDLATDGGEEEWLRDYLNPHAIAATRPNAYTRFTLLSIIRCLLEYADTEFTRDTAESVVRAAELYEMALELLNSAEIKQGVNACIKTTTDLIDDFMATLPDDIEPPSGGMDTSYNPKDWMIPEGRLEIILGLIDLDLDISLTDEEDLGEEVPIGKGDDGFTDPVREHCLGMSQFRMEMDSIGDVKAVEKLTTGLRQTITGPGTPAEKCQGAWQQLRAVKATMGNDTIRDANEKGIAVLEKAHTTMLAQPRLAASGVRVMELAGQDYLNSVSEKPFSDGGGSMPLILKSPAKFYSNANQEPIFVRYEFCIPPNPIIRALVLWAELNLYKLRNSLNIAGLERQLEPYGAPTNVESGIPAIGTAGNLVMPVTTTARPTPYRYSVLIERAKHLAQIAGQIESAMLAAFEKRDHEQGNIQKARQDLLLARAKVRLQDLRIREATDGVRLAELRLGRAQIHADHYASLLEAGWLFQETAAILLIGLSAAIQFMVAAAHGAALVAAGATAGSAAEGAGAAPGAAGGAAASASADIMALQAISGGLSAGASALSMWASFERRRQEWELQLSLAQQDIRIGAQEINIADDRVRIVGQERAIDDLQAQHSEAIVEFLAGKFTNVELYDWISTILRRVYGFFLQQATATAQIAAQQLAFERKDPPPQFIQGDYWEAPADGYSGSSSGNATDRRGLTGSTRLLQDIYQLDQFAFDTDSRKLALTKTLSLARMAPLEFQRFRETGVMNFGTPSRLFDQDFPGHYLRLIKRVRVSVVALVPPSQEIHATLSTVGFSRVALGGPLFDTVVIRHYPSSIALTSPRDATGVFEMAPQSEMLLPFEGMGVDTTWEFRLPKPANLFDYGTIADVLFAIEYTAFDSPMYRHQVIQMIDRTAGADRPFSFRHQFPDQWYDLHNLDPSASSLAVSFNTTRADFPANMDDLRISHITLYFAGAPTRSFEVPVTHLRFTEEGIPGFVGGSARSVGGVISTLAGNAGSWTQMIGKSPVGQWELALPIEVKDRFQAGEIGDILFVIAYSARTAEWPA